MFHQNDFFIMENIFGKEAAKFAEPRIVQLITPIVEREPKFIPSLLCILAHTNP